VLSDESFEFVYPGLKTTIAGFGHRGVPSYQKIAEVILQADLDTS
jgi:hypothetical protein